MLLLAASLLAVTSGRVRGDWRQPTQEPRANSAPTGSPFPIPASLRDTYRDWMLDRARGMKAAFAEHNPKARAALAQLGSDPVAQSVDWPSFFAEQPEAWDFPEMMVLNHSWFVWKTQLGLDQAFPSNVLADGQVPNSAFFINSDVASYTPAWLRHELEDIRPQGEITVTRAKQGGTAEGFFGKDRRGREYIFVFDPPFNPEMITSAEYIGSTLVRIAGYHVPKTVVVRLNCPDHPEYHGRRAVATIALEGFKGTWTYRANRNRRELRGLRVLAAWLHNVDQTSQNTANSVRDGVALRFIFDFGASLGSFTYRAKWPGLGEHYLFAPTGHLGGAVTGGEWREPFTLVSPAVGYFPRKLDPDRWRPFYRNFAFEAATRADNQWAAQLLAKFSDAQIRTVVELADYSNPDDADYVIETLKARRDRLVRYYLTREGPGAAHGLNPSSERPEREGSPWNLSRKQASGPPRREPRALPAEPIRPR